LKRIDDKRRAGPVNLRSAIRNPQSAIFTA
jgi:hypothetical protein